jgi:hypothetical protein
VITYAHYIFAIAHISIGHLRDCAEAARLAELTGSFLHHHLDPENPAMRTARFYTGLVILAAPAMAILVVIQSQRAAPSGPVEGTVLSDRPSVGGMIVFSPADPRDGEGSSARIDEDGHFECNPLWRRDRAGRMRYRMDIMLPPDPASAPPPGDPGGRPEAGGDAETDPLGAQERRPARRIARASLSSGGRPSPGRSVGSGRRRRPGDAQVMQRDVWLGPEPAHLDIDLRG